MYHHDKYLKSIACQRFQKIMTKTSKLEQIHPRKQYCLILNRIFDITIMYK